MKELSTFEMSSIAGGNSGISIGIGIGSGSGSGSGGGGGGGGGGGTHQGTITATSSDGQQAKWGYESESSSPLVTGYAWYSDGSVANECTWEEATIAVGQGIAVGATAGFFIEGIGAIPGAVIGATIGAIETMAGCAIDMANGRDAGDIPPGN